MAAPLKLRPKKTWDVYIRMGTPTPEGGTTTVKTVQAPDPDGALDVLEMRAEYIPKLGDRIARCVCVDDGRGRNEVA